ncbi:MAG: hypothetical protein AB8H03_21975 [Saprospiraceae bacterium]
MKKILILLIAISFILGCEKEATVNKCNILPTLEKVNELIDKCNENQFNSKSEIEDNLIGEWALSGVISDWIDFEPISECLLLTINNDSFILKNLETNEEFSSTWEMVSYEVNDLKVFYLEANDQELRWKVGMQNFSKNIMYGSGNADDTDTYVYKKLR